MPEPMGKLDTVEVNGPEGEVLDWDAVDWRRVEDNVRRLRQRIFTGLSLAGFLGRGARRVFRGPRRGDASGLPDWRIWFYVLEAAGLSVQLVNARDVKNVPGRPKTDKLDALWLAKLTEKGLLRPSFVPPAPIRELRDYTRLRIDLTRERSRYWQRLEKLLEDALIKVSAVASTLD